MTWTLQLFHEWDAEGAIQASFHFEEAEISLSKTDKDPAQIQKCLIFTLAGRRLGFDKAAVPEAELAADPHVDLNFLIYEKAVSKAT